MPFGKSYNSMILPSVTLFLSCHAFCSGRHSRQGCHDCYGYDGGGDSHDSYDLSLELSPQKFPSSGKSMDFFVLVNIINLMSLRALYFI